MANTPRRQFGRFIKKGDPIRKVLNITDFNLAEICENPYTSADNANANIIHEKLHDPQELLTGVRNSQEINNIFSPNEERIVIRPLDFTEEWRRQKKRMANRQTRMDDDDDLDIFAQPQQNEDDDEDYPRSPYAMPRETTPAPAPSPIKETPKAPEAAFVPPVTQQTSPASPAASAKPAPPTAKPATPPAASPAKPATPPAAPIPQTPIQAIAQKHDAFVPLLQEEEEEEPPVPTISEEELEAIREAARQEGYQVGYRLGEEKATLEARQKVSAIIGEVGNIIGELQGMQKSILGHVQENFQMICQSLIESLLQREFRMNPESFGLIIERAISEAVPDDEFKVYVSSSVAKDLGNWQNSSLKSHIKSDDSLKGFHFRVEGKHGTVDADLQKIISELLNQADLNLFEDQEQAS